jgi:hypothetical protein
MGRVIRSVGVSLGDGIAEQVVIEIPLRHAPYELVQLLLGFIGQPGGGQHSVVPVVSHDKLIKAESSTRNGSVDCSPALRVVYLEGFPVSSSTDLVLLSAANEIVLIGIEGKQHPEVPLRINVKDEQVAVILGADLHLGTVARQEAAIIVNPEANRWVVMWRSRWRGGHVQQQGK